ncbi:PNK3P-domain-containing protein [Hymenopellis radicata]|nr:PNK3P-domain-containing protein [Hymenopellis radicata]
MVCLNELHPFFSKEKAVASNSAFMWHKSLGRKASCLFGLNLSPSARPKVAAFDLDGTLIKSSFGKGKGKTKADSIEWWRPSVPQKLQSLHDEGYSIVIISNQALKPAALATWKQKIQTFSDSLPDLPFYLFSATGKDEFRKPNPGMWNELERIFSDKSVVIDKTQSFFVGDAAGRRYGPKDKDFASTDRKWALNLGLPFYTPEEYFLSLPAHADYVLDGFNVSSLPTLPLLLPTSTPLLPDPPHQEVVVFVGYPCLGKSSFYGKHFAPSGYVHVNQDTLGSRPKCISAAKAALKEGKSVVIDNTNRDASTRKYYVDLAKDHDVPVRCFSFTGSAELAWHNNLYRAFNRPPSLSSTEQSRELLPYLAFSGFKANYEPPDEKEGFSEIRQVNWVFEGTDEERRHWSMWLQI